MGWGQWFTVVVFAVISVALARLLPPMWRSGRRSPDLMPHFWVWAIQVALTASVPIVMLASWGRVGWIYEYIVAGLVLLAGIVLAVLRRKPIAAELRDTWKDRRRRSGL